MLGLKWIRVGKWGPRGKRSSLILVQVMASRPLGAQPLQYWRGLNWSFGNTLQWNLNQNRNIFINKISLKIWSAKWWPFCSGLKLIAAANPAVRLDTKILRQPRKKGVRCNFEFTNLVPYIEQTIGVSIVGYWKKDAIMHTIVIVKSLESIINYFKYFKSRSFN